MEGAVNVLVVVDMQNDFIDGALGTKEAVAIVPKVLKKVNQWDGLVFYTRDTHEKDYLDTQEGQKLPVPHCIRGTEGWELHKDIKKCVVGAEFVIDKPTFGSGELANLLVELNDEQGVASIMLVGLCTDICVISNAMILKAVLPEVPIAIDAECCAGVTLESHEIALKSMETCQIEIIR